MLHIAHRIEQRGSARPTGSSPSLAETSRFSKSRRAVPWRWRDRPRERVGRPLMSCGPLRRRGHRCCAGHAAGELGQHDLVAKIVGSCPGDSDDSCGERTCDVIALWTAVHDSCMRDRSRVCVLCSGAPHCPQNAHTRRACASLQPASRASCVLCKSSPHLSILFGMPVKAAHVFTLSALARSQRTTRVNYAETRWHIAS